MIQFTYIVKSYIFNQTIQSLTLSLRASCAFMYFTPLCLTLNSRQTSQYVNEIHIRDLFSIHLILRYTRLHYTAPPGEYHFLCYSYNIEWCYIPAHVKIIGHWKGRGLIWSSLYSPSASLFLPETRKCHPAEHCCTEDSKRLIYSAIYLWIQNDCNWYHSHLPGDQL